MTRSERISGEGASAPVPGNDDPKGYAQMWTDGGGDPTFDEIDGFLFAHFNARAVHIDSAVPAVDDRERLIDHVVRLMVTFGAHSDESDRRLLAGIIIDSLAGVSLTGSGLDVERLARAQVRSGIDTFLPGEERWISANEAQAAIAREYAALHGESGEAA
jgi:hypothetical protein